MSAIYILWLRELKRYVRSRAQIVASLGQPMLYLVALGFGMGPVFQKAGQGNYVQFIAPGIIAMTVLFSSVFSGVGLLWDRQFGFLKETLVAPVPRLQIMLGRTLGAATVACIQGSLVAIVCLIASVVTAFVLAPWGQRSSHIEAGEMVVDLGVLAAFVLVALRSDRFWPLWVAGLQLTSSLAHVMKGINLELLPQAYAAATKIWRRMYQSEEQLARDALAFMKRETSARGLN